MHIKNPFRHWLRGLWMLWTEALWALKIWDLRLKQMKNNQFATRIVIPKRTVACSWLEKINSIRPIPQCSPNKPNHPSSTKTKPQILHTPIEKPGHRTPCITYQCSSGTKNTYDRKISDWPNCVSKLSRKSDNNKKSALSNLKFWTITHTSSPSTTTYAHRESWCNGDTKSASREKRMPMSRSGPWERL